MTEVIRWQPHRKDGLHSIRGPLPEPPRHKHTSRSVPAPTDRVGKSLEDWLTSVSVTTTLDAD